MFQGPGLIDEAIGKIGRALKDFFTGWLSLDWIPEIFFWYWYLFVLFLVVSLVIYLFGWIKFVRAAASTLFLLGAVFVAGGHFMQRRLEERQKRRRR